MSSFIVLTPPELDVLIQDSIRKVLLEIEPSSSNEKEILTISEASQYLNLAKQTIYGFTSKNIIPFIKKGKKLYFRRSELKDWLLESRQMTTIEVKAAGFGALNRKKGGSKL